MKHITMMVFIALTQLLLVACSGNDAIQNEVQDSEETIVHTIIFTSMEAPVTRTSITHTIGNGAVAFWSTDDYIFVKDDGGTFHKSDVGTFNAEMTRGVFRIATGQFTGLNHTVSYTGTNATNGDQVTIATLQSQTSPNDFSHAGTSGDCGIATATGKNGSYMFYLEHKASYLCLLPRITNEALRKNVYLEKIIVTSATSDIAGTYDFSTGSIGTAPLSGGSKTITLNTNNQPVSQTTDINGSYYMVIAPGTHTLTIDYYIKDPLTNVEGIITKNLPTATFDANKITDITANLQVLYYDDVTYMWDAQQDYWYGYKDSQPFIDGITNDNYPKSYATDQPRWYNIAVGLSGSAFRTAAICPNANEMVWYAMKGDPHWDNNRVWTYGGHLYKGGMWLKKKSIIATENGTTFDKMKEAYNSIDHRLIYAASSERVNRNVVHTPLSDTTNYFYLPAINAYLNGSLFQFGMGNYGDYWSSSSTPSNTENAINLAFTRDDIGIYGSQRIKGAKTKEFQ